MVFPSFIIDTIQLYHPGLTPEENKYFLLIFSRDNLVIYELVNQPITQLNPVSFSSGQSKIETISFA